MATVLDVTIPGVSVDNENPEVVVPIIDFKCVRTGEAVIAETLTPSINRKLLGVYKTPAQLNQNAIDAVKDYLDATYGINSFNSTLLLSGWGNI